jgi:radical SAM protein with 4Fe4S-binding SPASM domain
MNLQTLKKCSIDYALWEVTSNCNLACLHCRAAATPEIIEKDNIKGEEAKRLLISLANLKTKTLVFTGGEPLLRDDLEDIISYAVSLGIRCRIQSNGLLLTHERAEKFKNIGVFSFGIGLDSPNSNTHDKIRNCKGAFDIAVNAIKIIKDVGLACHVETTLSQFNINDLESMFTFVTSLGVDTFLARSAIFSGRTTTDKSEFVLTKDEYHKTLLKLYELSRQHKNIISGCQDPLYNTLKQNFTDKISQIKSSTSKQILCGCSAGLNMVDIHSSGEIGLCTFLKHIVIGNIKKSSLEDIWERRFENSQEIADCVSRNLKGKCQNCAYRYFCGGCRARALAVNKNILESDPYCWN